MTAVYNSTKCNAADMQVCMTRFFQIEAVLALLHLYVSIKSLSSFHIDMIKMLSNEAGKIVRAATLRAGQTAHLHLCLFYSKSFFALLPEDSQQIVLFFISVICFSLAPKTSTENLFLLSMVLWGVIWFQVTIGSTY